MKEIFSPEKMGRHTDTALGHLSLGEVVIPRALLDDPEVNNALQKIFDSAQLDMREFTVGDKSNKINPETGYPEFFSFGKIFKSLAPIALPILGSIVAPGIGTALGSSLSGAALGGIGGAAGGGLGGLVSGGGAKGALLGSALGGAGGYLANGGLSALGDSLSGSSGLGSLIGTKAGSVLQGGVGPTAGSGLLGGITRGASALSSSPLGSMFSSGPMGSTSFGLGSALISGLGGAQETLAQRRALDKLLAGNNQQLANLNTFDPSNITNDAGYQFNLAEGQKGLDRAAAARGNFYSGAALKDAAQYNQNYANNALKDAYARWADRTGAQNQIISNSANAGAAGTLANSNTLNQTLANMFRSRVGNYNGGDTALARLLAGVA